ncbi:RICIN domain-containing protein [Gandjariella thermophila]|uniref:Ricin B lectin domain-containing protein n=1 Tax=Gandjariella thermophila TaxID=1931992 RepID=A0A4D4J8C1_9PSEU|nr:RICIN domain-containing protein [Gandjariella thermophila]GDY30756.1 hypothetical protein GTS_23890 [Gandjariella thermophila]
MRISKGLKVAVASTAAAIGIIFAPCAATAAPQPKQVVPQPGSYQIVSRHNGSRWVTALDSAGDANARAVRAPAWDSFTSDQWNIIGTGLAGVTIQNAKGGKCLEPLNASFTLHQQVVVRTCNGSRAQRWLITRAADTSFLISPLNEPTLAVALASAGTDDWTELRLEKAWYSTDRLWNFVG